MFRDVEVEPYLQPIDGEVMKLKSANLEVNARSDVRCRDYWTAMPAIRKREYGQRVRELDDADFTPMIMSSTGGMGGEMSVAFKQLAHKIADKQGERYASVISMMRSTFSFAMARCALVCLRGSKAVFGKNYRHSDPMESVELAFSEAGVRRSPSY